MGLIQAGVIIVSFTVSLMAGAQVQKRGRVIVAMRFITILNFLFEPKVLLQAPYLSTSPVVDDNASQGGGDAAGLRNL